MTFECGWNRLDGWLKRRVQARAAGVGRLSDGETSECKTRMRGKRDDGAVKRIKRFYAPNFKSLNQSAWRRSKKWQKVQLFRFPLKCLYSFRRIQSLVLPVSRLKIIRQVNETRNEHIPLFLFWYLIVNKTLMGGGNIGKFVERRFNVEYNLSCSVLKIVQ